MSTSEQNQCDAGQCTTGTKPTAQSCSTASTECDMPEKLLCLADQAWKELMIEALKAEIKASCGERIQSIAQLVAKTNKAKWDTLVSSKARCNDYKAQLFELLSACSA